VHEVYVARNVSLPDSRFLASSSEATVPECGFEVGVERAFLTQKIWEILGLKSVYHGSLIWQAEDSS